MRTQDTADRPGQGETMAPGGPLRHYFCERDLAEPADSHQSLRARRCWLRWVGNAIAALMVG